MKTKSLFLFRQGLRYLFRLFLIVGWVSSATVGDVYVNPKVLAKQYLTELALKEALIKAFNNESSCFINLGQTSGLFANLNALKHGGCSKGNCTSKSDCEIASHACNDHCSNSASCKSQVDCESDHDCNNQSAGIWEASTAGVWTAPADAVTTTGAFDSKNIEVVKMEVTGSAGPGDRTFKAYYKRTGLEVYNTIDNQTCTSANRDGCFEAECTIDFNSTGGSEKCELETCCDHCWSISGGL